MTGQAATTPTGLVGVLAIGGTHVTSALVDPQEAQVVSGSVCERPIDSGASARDLIDSFAAAVEDAEAPKGAAWAIAIPGPFDYLRGVGRFKGVGKFDALLDVDVASRLRAAQPRLTGTLTFVNDADAFAIGEWHNGVADGASRCVGITLGTGVGSCFLAEGVPVTEGPDVPPDGRLHRLRIGASDLEDVVSRRAILGRYQSAPDATGSRALDVFDVFERSRHDDGWATRVLQDAFRALGEALAPWLTRFDATVVACGGAMTGSWDQILPPLQSGLAEAGASSDIELLPSADTEQSALRGAATCISRESP